MKDEKYLKNNQTEYRIDVYSCTEQILSLKHDDFYIIIKGKKKQIIFPSPFKGSKNVYPRVVLFFSSKNKLLSYLYDTENFIFQN